MPWILTVHRRALAGLIDQLNTHDIVCPGTDLPVTYHLAVHQSSRLLNPHVQTSESPSYV